MTTGLATRSVGRPVKKNQHVRQKTGGTVAQQLPEYLLPDQVEALMKQAPNAQAEVLMLTQWRAGLRISEALGLEVGDLVDTIDPDWDADRNIQPTGLRLVTLVGEPGIGKTRDCQWGS